MREGYGPCFVGLVDEEDLVGVSVGVGAVVVGRGGFGGLRWDMELMRWRMDRGTALLVLVLRWGSDSLGLGVLVERER